MNSKSKLKPVGMFLFATPEKMFGKVKGSMDGKKTRRSKRKSQDSTQKEDESEDDGEGGEGWLGKDERFVSTISFVFSLHSAYPQAYLRSRETFTGFFQHVIEFDDLSMRKETDKGYCAVEVVEAEVDPHLDRAIHVRSRPRAVTVSHSLRAL